MIEIILIISILWNVACFIYTISLIKKIQIVNKANSLTDLFDYETWNINKGEDEIFQ